MSMLPLRLSSQCPPRLLPLLIALLLLLSSVLASPDRATRPRHATEDDVPLSEQLRASMPNMVLVMADDMGWGDVGFNWANSRDTPFLDSLAKESLVLLDHHSGASVCSPSRAALLTGRLGARTGVWQNFPNVAAGGLPTNETILAEYFKEAGYICGAHGKWHLGTRPPFHPSFRGFDELVTHSHRSKEAWEGGSEGQRYLGIPFSLDNGCTDNPGYYHPALATCPKDPQPLPLHYEPFPSYPSDAANLSIAVPLYQCLSPLCAGGDGDCNKEIIEQPVNLTTLSDHYVEGDRRFIQASVAKGKPFFLYVPLSHMHVPHATAPEWVGKGSISVYTDTLRELDNHLNRTYHVLVDEGVINETLFIFTSDNGPWLAQCDYAGSQGKFAGLWQSLQEPDGGGGGGAGKFTTWEAGHRVPFLAHWPGKIAPRRSSALTSNLDLVPTLLSLTNVSLPTDRSFDGQSIAPTLFDSNDTAHTFLFHPDQNGSLTAMRYQHYKAYYQTYSANDGACGGKTAPIKDHYPPLVFDLSRDEPEGYPIEVSKELLKVLDDAREAKMNDIRTTARSKPDYSEGTMDDRPCCDAGHIVCRCDQ